MARLLPPPVPPRPLPPEDEGDEARERAVTQVADHADQTWMATALAIVDGLSQTRSEITTDDVWEVLDDLDTETHDNRAMGAVMIEAGRSGWLHRTDTTTLSRRAINHRRPVRVWRSLRYDEPEMVPGSSDEVQPPSSPMSDTRVSSGDHGDHGDHSVEPTESSTGNRKTAVPEPVPDLGALIGDPILTSATEVDAMPNGDLLKEDGWSGHMEMAIETAATQMAALRAVSGQSRRRYWKMACPEHGYWLLSTGMKGLDSTSTWMGYCATCRRAEAGDLAHEIEVPSYPTAPKVSAEVLAEVEALVDGEAQAPELEKLRMDLTPEEAEAFHEALDGEADAPEDEEAQARGPIDGGIEPTVGPLLPPPPRRQRRDGPF